MSRKIIVSYDEMHDEVSVKFDPTPGDLKRAREQRHGWDSRSFDLVIDPAAKTVEEYEVTYDEAYD